MNNIWASELGCAQLNYSTNIVAAASEFEQDMTRERMSDSRAMLKQNGKRVAGRVPFDYSTDPHTKMLVAHPDQSVVVRDQLRRVWGHSIF